MSLRILLLSSYDADSHHYWHQGLVDHFPQYHWTRLTLPPRYFSWRVRGNPLSWAFGPQAKHLHQAYDLLIATSMVDLATLRGLIPQLTRLPTLLYFHENQFAYPLSSHAPQRVEPQMVSLYAALAADQLVFNSHYNQTSFLKGLQALLTKLPDQIPTGLTEHLARKSQVLPVPLTADCFHPPRASSQAALQVVWNHRWEYDKGPHRLLALIEQADLANLPVRFHIVGQQFRQQPAPFQQIHRHFSHLIGHWGYVAKVSAYRRLLQQADVVLSTAEHDFQGIALLEGVAAGAIPVAPERLAYPELLGSDWLYPSHLAAPEQEAQQVVQRLRHYCHQKQQGTLPGAPDIRSLSWSALGPAYQALLEQLANRTV